MPNILAEKIRGLFSQRDIYVRNVDVKSYPGEVIAVVHVPEDQFSDALSVASDVDDDDDNILITVKKYKDIDKPKYNSVKDVFDDRITSLIALLSEKSRVSEGNPSLKYIRDINQNLDLCMTPRHHLIFGRRGVGKSALMVEANRILRDRGAHTVWINLQTLRNQASLDAFITIVQKLLDLPLVYWASKERPPASSHQAGRLKEMFSGLLVREDKTVQAVAKHIPEIQSCLHLFTEETQQPIYIFLDDIHYISMAELPTQLDLIHGISRDSNIWIKASGIRHQARWFSDDPPVGLQIGHDAAEIDLDITLEEPTKARNFLLGILRTYLDDCHLSGTTNFIASTALDRLVLASGAVPRDYLNLAALALQAARERENARTTGVQDVNKAAGNAADHKLKELEDDAASAIGHAQARMETLSKLENYLLYDVKTTYFRIDFRSKEKYPQEYSLLQSLMDLRMVHLIASSISDEHKAGHRSEVYMLDLSRFTGSRLKQKLTVLDFNKNIIVTKRTGTKEPPKEGKTSRAVLGILRRAPELPLEMLEQPQA